MRRQVATALRVCTVALVFFGYLAIATVAEYGGWILFIPLGTLLIVPMGEWLDGRFPVYRRVTAAVALGYLVALPVTIFYFGLLGSVTGLIIFIQTYELLHRKDVYSYYRIFLMAFFLLLAACVQSPDAAIGLVMVLFLLSAVWGFLLLQVYVEFEENKQGSVADIIPLYVREMLEVPKSARFLDPGFVVSLVAVSLACALMTVGLFVAAPRAQMGFISSDEATTGLDDRVDLSVEGKLLQDRTPTMRVAFPDEPDGRYNRRLRWRSTSLDEYTGDGWERSDLNVFWKDSAPKQRVAPFRRIRGTLTRVPARQGRVVHQLIYLDKVPPSGLPCLSWVREVVSPGARLQWASSWDGTVEVGAGGRAGMQYEAWSEVQEPRPAELRKALPNYRDVAARTGDYYRLTFHDLESRTMRLARQLTVPHDTIYDRVMAIQRWLRSDEFTYTLDIPRLPEERPIDFFVHEAKEGHCELFASAMALMVRSLGVPARMVVGYRGGLWDNEDQSYKIRADMAHTWVEVYFVDYGWVTFDPSPADEDEELLEVATFDRLFSRAGLRAKMFWYSNVLGFDSGIRLDRLRDIKFGLAGFIPSFMRTTTGPELESRAQSRLWTILVLAALGAMVLGGFLLSVRRPTRRRRHRFPLSQDQVRAVRLFQQLRRKLARGGADCEAKTAKEILESLRRSRLVDVPFAASVLETYNQVRFGGRPLHPDTYAALRRTIRSLRLADG